MAFTTSKHPSGVVIVEVEGQLIVGNRQELKATIQKALDNGERKFLIDFAKTGYIDSSGLGRAGLALEEGPRAGRGAAPRRPQRGPPVAVRADQARHPLRHRRQLRGGARRVLTRPDRDRAASALRPPRRPPTAPGIAVEIALRIPSDVSVVEEAVELVARHCFAGWDAPKRAQFRLRVALSEALANAIVYGNGQAPTRMVEVRAECLPDALHVQVTDEGPGFDPATVRDPVTPDDLELPCGRGLFLIRNLVDDVRFNPRGIPSA